MADIVLDNVTESVALTDRSVDSDTNWSQVTRKIASGCTTSFQIYYESFFDLMFLEARRIISKDEHRCLDVVHDAMIKAIRSMKQFENEAKLSAWSRTVVRSVAYDWLRRQISEKLRHAEARDFLVNISDEKFVQENASKLIWLEAQLQELDPDLRRMVRLRYRLEWPLKKIANHFGIKTGAVDGKLRRLTQRLKKLAESEFDEQN